MPPASVPHSSAPAKPRRRWARRRSLPAKWPASAERPAAQAPSQIRQGRYRAPPGRRSQGASTGRGLDGRYTGGSAAAGATPEGRQHVRHPPSAASPAPSGRRERQARGVYPSGAGAVRHRVRRRGPHGRRGGGALPPGPPARDGASGGSGPTPPLLATPAWEEEVPWRRWSGSRRTGRSRIWSSGRSSPRQLQDSLTAGRRTARRRPRCPAPASTSLPVASPGARPGTYTGAEAIPCGGQGEAQQEARGSSSSRPRPAAHRHRTTRPAAPGSGCGSPSRGSPIPARAPTTS